MSRFGGLCIALTNQAEDTLASPRFSHHEGARAYHHQSGQPEPPTAFTPRRGLDDRRPSITHRPSGLLQPTPQPLVLHSLASALPGSLPYASRVASRARRMASCASWL